MSTLKVINSIHPSGSTNNLVFDSSGNTTAGGTLAMSSSFLRNRIINGAMVISQRNGTSSTTVATGDGITYSTDRWRYQRSSTFCAASTQQTTTVPNGNFTNSLLTTVTTGGAAAAGDYLTVGQAIEGYNVADLAYGTAAAQTVTLSFWARASVTGTYSASLYSPATNRAYIKTFSVSVANTWTYYTLTIPGDTVSAINTDNTIGLYFRIDLGSGSSFNGTADTWQSGAFRTSGSVSLSATTNATFYITGVQLEVGSVATPFERRPYGTELMLAYRYYQKLTNFKMAGVAGGTYTINRMGGNLPVPMRSSPTVGLVGTADVYNGNTVGTFNSLNVAYSSPYMIEIDAVAATGTYAVNQPLVTYVGTAWSMTASAEL